LVNSALKINAAACSSEKTELKSGRLTSASLTSDPNTKEAAIEVGVEVAITSKIKAEITIIRPNLLTAACRSKVTTTNLINIEETLEVLPANFITIRRSEIMATRIITMTITEGDLPQGTMTTNTIIVPSEAGAIKCSPENKCTIGTMTTHQ
jgi:hypothetical protein